ncbi:MAG: SpaH/EbpB family LPXTG-anchored major pilin [Lachnospiraceae bacterium]|nr:SpaH/EbpB family LPXTG-anchored major pilin [Lachnospiraceae bacterium]
MKKRELWKKAGVMMLATVMIAGVGIANVKAAPYDKNADCSITVHSYALSGGGKTAGGGTKITDAGEIGKLGSGMSGVGYSVYSLDLKDALTKVAGYSEDWYLTGTYAFTPGTANEVSFDIKDSKGDADKTNDTDVTAKLKIDDVTAATQAGTEQMTDGKGETTFAKLKQGYYAVINTTPVNGVTAQPSIVTLPMSKTGADGAIDYNYDVHTYPKADVDGKASMTKTLEKATAIYGGGSKVTYTCDANIVDTTDADNSIATATDLKTFTVNEKVAAGLAFKNEDGDVTVAYKDAAKTETVVDVTDTQNGSVAEDKGVVTVTLTEKTLDEMAAANATVIEIKIQEQVQVRAIAATEILSESAEMVMTTDKKADDADKIKIQGSVAAPVEINCIKVEKVDQKDTEKRLNDAEFIVCKDGAMTEFLKADGSFSTDAKDAVTVKTAEVNTEKGVAMIAGVPYDVAKGTDLCLKETKAPTGYEFKNMSYEVKFTAGQTDNGSVQKIQITNAVTGTEDQDNPLFTLPLTGGMGTYIFILAGVVLMIVAGSVYVSSKKKNSQE